MSHIHLPDGTMPAAWWVAGLIITAMVLMFCIRRINGDHARMQVPFLGAMSALMLVTMSVPLGPLPFHLNLTVLTGIIAGPALGFVTVFLVNVVLSFLGHGGLTTIGLNTLITGVEVYLGWWVFHHLLKQRTLVSRAVMAPIMALLVSISLTVGLIGVSTGVWSAAIPHEEHGPETVLTATHHEEPQSLKDALREVEFLSMAGVSAMAAILFLGLLTETAATLMMVRFFSKVRPDLLNQRK